MSISWLVCFSSKLYHTIFPLPHFKMQQMLNGVYCMLPLFCCWANGNIYLYPPNHNRVHIHHDGDAWLLMKLVMTPTRYRYMITPNYYYIIFSNYCRCWCRCVSVRVCVHASSVVALLFWNLEYGIVRPVVA